MGVFSKVFRKADSSSSSRATSRAARDGPQPIQAQPVKYEDGWARKTVAAEEVQELLQVCTQEMKSRALDMPFLLLPFRPNSSSDSNAAKTFIRNFFRHGAGQSQMTGASLVQELRITEPMALCSIMKWCWSRLSGGVVGWNTYELFRQGEQESNMAKHAFDTFIPLSVESEARRRIVFDFFELLAAVAAHGKTNGLGGRKLSRLAGWWAFDHSDNGKGLDGGYQSWASAAAATTHLFFAYLRSLAPETAVESTVSKLPRSLQALLAQTEYPPDIPTGLLSATSKVVMLVTAVSPTPFALLRRARNFEYYEDDRALQAFSDYDDPVKALTSECRRVLEAISSTNSTPNSLPELSMASPNSPRDESWSKFEDMGFSSVFDGSDANGHARNHSHTKPRKSEGARRSGVNDLGRPATPSWADFMSSGFSDDESTRTPNSLGIPSAQMLPPLSPGRVQSSQSHVKGMRDDGGAPGELAGITRHDMDETFWWVWMTSLAHEEPPSRKAVFGRCAFVETNITGGRWLVVEEQIKGASTVPQETVMITQKKNRFATFSMRNRDRRSSMGKPPPVPKMPYESVSHQSKTTIGPDQQARVQAAAAALVQRKIDEEDEKTTNRRRGRTNEQDDAKTNSVMTLQPLLAKEATPALQWARKFDKETTRQQYLGDNSAGKGLATGYSPTASTINLETALSAGEATDRARRHESLDRELPPPPAERGLTAAAFLSSSHPPSVPAKNDSMPHSAAPAGSSMDAVKHILQQNSQPGAANLANGTRSPVNRTPSPTVTRKPVQGIDKIGRDSFGPVRPSVDQQPPSTPQKSAAAMAAAAATKASPTNAKITKSPTKEIASRKASTKNFRNMFNNKRQTQTPEALAAQRAMNGNTNGSTLSVEKTPVGRTSSFLRRKQISPKPEPEVPTMPSAPFANPSTTSRPASAADEPARIREQYYKTMEQGEPGPEINTSDPEVSTPHKEAVLQRPEPPFTRNANESSGQFSNFSQGPLEDMPAFVPDDDPIQPDERAPSPVQPVPGPFVARAAGLLGQQQVGRSPSPSQALAGSAPSANGPMPSSYTTRAAALLAPGRNAPEPPRSESPVIRTSETPNASNSEFRTPMETFDNDPMDAERTPKAMPTAPGASPSTESIAALPEPTLNTKSTNATQPRKFIRPDPSPPEATESAADRWAQIRANAAQRRTSEEQRQRGYSSAKHSQTQSFLSDKTDEGETSGEETIESRVARIKARVAELTSGSNLPAGAPVARA